MDQEENDNNMKYEQMLTEENDELVRELQKLQEEINNVQAESAAQKIAYNKQIDTKNNIINCNLAQ